MVELLDEEFSEEKAPPPKMEQWEKYRQAILKKMTYRRLPILLLVVAIFAWADYQWGGRLMMGQIIWGFIFYTVISMPYLLLALTVDFSEDYRHNAPFIFIGPFFFGVIMFMVILWIQIDIEGSLDPRAATAIVPWRWNALVYVLLSEACNHLLFVTSFNKEKMNKILRTNKEALLEYLG